MSVTSRAPVASSHSTSLGNPLVQSLHGTSADTGTGASTSSSRTGAGTNTPRSIGKPSSSPDWGAEDEVPYGEASSGKRTPKWLQDTLKEAKFVGPPKRVNRESVPPERFCSYVAKATTIIDSETTSYEEAASQEVWREARVEEYASIIKNNVWEVVPRPEGKSGVTSRWLYKIKHAVDGSIKKFKVKFVARGLSQIEGVDYDETFTPVARYTSIRSLISIVA